MRRPLRRFDALLPAILAVLGPVPLGLLAPAEASAQTARLTYELRGGATVPVQELAEADEGWTGEVGEGISFGMDFAYAFSRHASAYAGFSQHRFACSRTGCGRESDLAATGFDLGIRLFVGGGAVVPWLRGGFLTYRVEGNAPGPGRRSVGTVSERTEGVEGGLGLTVRLSPSLYLRPGLRYARLSPDFPDMGELGMEFLLADLGLVVAF